MSNSYVDLKQGGAKALYQTIEKSIDGGSIDIVRTLVRFVGHSMSSSLQFDNIENFVFFSNAANRFFTYAKSTNDDSASKGRWKEDCSLLSVQLLKEVMNWEIRDKLGLTDNFDWKKRNRYGEVVVNRFLDTIYFSISIRSYSGIRISLNYLSQCIEGYNKEIDRLKLGILRVKSSKGSGEVDWEPLQRDYEIATYLDSLINSSFCVSSFWCCFIYTQGAINLGELRKLLDEFREYSVLISSDILGRLLKLRLNSSDGGRAYENWDYVERQDGVVYSVDMPFRWLTIGAALYMLVEKVSLNMDFRDLKPHQVQQFEIMIEELIKNVTDLRSSNVDDLMVLCNVDTKVGLNLIIENLIAQLARFKVGATETRSKSVVEANVSASEIEAFKYEVFRGWIRVSIFRKALERFQVVKAVASSEGRAFSRVGKENYFLLNYRQFLLADKQLKQQLYGVDEFGVSLAREEELFLLGQLEREKADDEMNVVALLKYIKKVISRGYSVSLVVVGFDLAAKIFSNPIESFVFTSDMLIKEKEIVGVDVTGVNVEISFGESFRSRLLIADVVKAFELNVVANEIDRFKPLNLEVNVFDFEKADGYLKSHSTMFGQSSSDEVKIDLIRSSIEFSYTIDESFVVLDSAAYLFLEY